MTATNIQTKWEAYYYGGETANRELVSVYVDPNGLRINRASGVTEFWPYESILHTQGFHHGDPVHIENNLEAHKTIVVNQTGFIKAIKMYAVDGSKQFKVPLTKSQLARLTLYSIIGLLIIIPIIYFWALPKFSDFTVVHIPISWEEELGEAYIEVLAPDEQLCQNEEFNNYFKSILEKLLATIPESKYNYNLRVVDDDTVNAYALPGGYIILYRGLIEKMNSPEEVAGVLAHEIQHVEEKHGMKSMVHQLSFKVLIAMMVGDSQGVEQFLDTAGLLGSLGYGRDAEREADRKGMGMLHNSRVEPSGMVDFFKMIEEEYGDLSGGLEYFSTHPSTKDRIRYLEELSKEKTYEPIVLLKGINWDDLKNNCSSLEKEIKEEKSSY